MTMGESVTGSTQSAVSENQATFLVCAKVTEWSETHMVHDMTQKEFEQFVIDSAGKRGIDTNKPFPFVVHGEITNYTRHVVTGPVKNHGGDAQHRRNHASNRTFSGAKTTGKIVGFYSAEEFEGVISHPGERLHVHYADDNLKISGHLDGFGILKGATLLLPKK